MAAKLRGTGMPSGPDLLTLERAVLNRRYHPDGSVAATYQEIGAELNLTVEAAFRYRVNGLVSLRKLAKQRAAGKYVGVEATSDLARFRAALADFLRTDPANQADALKQAERVRQAKLARESEPFTPDTPIRKAGVSHRSAGILSRIGADTVGEVARTPDDTLRRAGIGPTGLETLRKRIPRGLFDAK